MTMETSSSQEATSVRKVVSVAAPPEVAWRVFTEKMGTWWPLGSHKIGEAAAADAVVEPRAGGRWYERGVDGTTCEWGRVVVWEPPARLVLAWQISADWVFDPSLETEVEVRFVREAEGRTRVELEHRNLDRYGARAAEMRGVFSSDGGWTGLLAAFAQAAAR